MYEKKLKKWGNQQEICEQIFRMMKVEHVLHLFFLKKNTLGT
jgi:hypothetical protein